MKRSFLVSARSLLSWVVYFFAVAIVVGEAGAGQPAFSTVYSITNISSSGDGDSVGPIISRDGRYVVFASTADNLVGKAKLPPAGASPCLNVFWLDRSSKTTKLVSIDRDGVGGGDGNSIPAAISADGRFVLFTSAASNLVANDTNSAVDVFLRDTMEDKTILVSSSTSGMPRNAASYQPVMSSDGAIIAFTSAATNLLTNAESPYPCVFVRDWRKNVTVLASAPTGEGALPNGESSGPAISVDGRYVAFRSTATNLAAGVYGAGDVFVRDLISNTTLWGSAGARAALPANSRQSAVCANPLMSDDAASIVFGIQVSNLTGSICRFNVGTGQTDLIDTNSVVRPGFRDDDCGSSIDMTADGSRVAYVARAASNSVCVKVWDASTQTSTLISANRQGIVGTNINAGRPSFDPSGHYVSFLSDARGLVTNSVPAEPHLYVYSLDSASTVLVDAGPNGAGLPMGWETSYGLSQGGQLVVFESREGTLVTTDFNRRSDVFVRDLNTGAIELASARAVDLPCSSPNGSSTISDNCMSADGRYLVFTSDADNLVIDDTNRHSDVFLKDMSDGSIRLVSRGTDGRCGSGPSFDPAISANGRYVAFASASTNFTPVSDSLVQDVYVRDLVAGTTVLASVATNALRFRNGDSYLPQVSDDGKIVMFRSRANNLWPNGTTTETFYVRNLETSQTYRLSSASVYDAKMTPDGKLIAFATSTSPCVQVWAANSHSVIYSNTTQTASLAISPEGRYLALGAPMGKTVNDLTLGTSSPLQTTLATVYTMSFSADSGSILLSGKPASGYPVNQVVLYSITNRSQVLVSHAAGSMTTTGRAPSDSASVSSNGRFVVYRGGAKELIPGLTNDQRMILLFDAQTGSNTVIAAAGYDAPGNRFENPILSPDNSKIVFQSPVALAGGDLNSAVDVVTFPLTSLSLDKSNYHPAENPSITVIAPSLNADPALVDTVQVTIQSDVDPTGFALSLQETGTNTGVFAFSGKLGFTTGPTDIANKLIHITDGAYIRASLSGGWIGQIDATALVSTNVAPVIRNPPVDTAVARGSTTTLQAGVLSSLPIGWQWFFQGAAITGATNATLTISNAQDANIGLYSVAISNASGTAVSAPVTLIVGDPPQILAQPADVRVTPFGFASFAVDVSGTPPISVQWWFNGTNQLPFVDAQIYLYQVQPENVGAYRAVLSNAFGTATSDPAQLRLTGDPPTFARPSLDSGKLHLPVAGQRGVIYLLLESDDLVTWTTNQVFNFDTDGQAITLPIGQRQKFYKLKEQ